MKAPPAGDSSSGAQALRPMRKDRPDETTAAACATMRDVTSSDLVTLDGDLLFHLAETEGLGIAGAVEAAE